MTGYTPKVGDKIRIVYDGTVVVGLDVTDYFRVRIADRTGSAAYPLCGEARFELVEAAPAPFEVGKPLTAEMGEPPVGSSVTYLTEGRQLRYTDTWIHTTTGWRDGDGSMMEWQFFAAAISGGVLVLDRLGDGK